MNEQTGELLVLPGPPALSRFKLKQLLARIQSSFPDVHSIYAEYVHLLVFQPGLKPENLSTIDRRKIDELLGYGPQQQLAVRETADTGASTYLCTVVPRIGTLSPWSSKASDILMSCGLDFVQRLERGIRWYSAMPGTLSNAGISDLLHDRMTESVIVESRDEAGFKPLFASFEPKPLVQIDLSGKRNSGMAELAKANQSLGLALSTEEMDYLLQAYVELERNPTDVELMMFAQANSEHCRHKIFNAGWIINGEPQRLSLFAMIRNTYKAVNGFGILSAYSDNAAVIEGKTHTRFCPDPVSHQYAYSGDAVDILMKVETHNHPTAIAPRAGAATGSGGEIRDEGAVGRGSKPKAGLSGFTTSHLNIPDLRQPWELDQAGPAHLASALDIMLEAPVGAASYNNEFGRPAICGYFRTFAWQADDKSQLYAYHKPIMLAGGLGSVHREHVHAATMSAGNKLVVLGGPAMLIGLGGGAASSMESGDSCSDLDFASVQRDNAEIERRCQEVIDSCCAMRQENPIILIHDVGAGGLSNALPELVMDGDVGGEIALRHIPIADVRMSPLEIWSNESQERYVLSIAAKDLDQFSAICHRERCPYAVVGTAQANPALAVTDQLFKNKPVDIPLSVLFGKPPRSERSVQRENKVHTKLDLTGIELGSAVDRVLAFPAVASKQFLITIGDRSITGLVAQQQMVGPWQVPVADVAVTLAGYDTYAAEAMALGERPALALVNSAAAARMAVGEALSNLAAAAVVALPRVVLSANWMAAAGQAGQDEALFDAVQAIGMQLCPALGIAIPVGKDSLSMHTAWSEGGENYSATSPVSLNVTAFAPVTDARLTLTPWMKLDQGDSRLLLIDLGQGKNRLSASALAQVYSQLGDECPDLDDAELFAQFFNTIQTCLGRELLLAYHDRSDGGLFTSILEMAIASRCGIEMDLSCLSSQKSGVTSEAEILALLFNEELGAVVQVRELDFPEVMSLFSAAGLSDCVHDIARARKQKTDNSNLLQIKLADEIIFERAITELHQQWARTSFAIQKMRDNPACARQEFDNIVQNNDPGQRTHLSFDLNELPNVLRGAKPQIAVLRDQGVNGQVEMAAAFERSGFDAVDVHMTDLLSGGIQLERFQSLVACGGFSYGDVLGGGGGWSKSILYHEYTRDCFEKFFQRDVLVLGVCNGCQMLSGLKQLIPGAQHWPRFVENESEQFEARTSLVKISGDSSSSPWLSEMQGSVLTVPIAHGEGRLEFDSVDDIAKAKLALEYVDHHHQVTEQYPYNPNGAVQGIAGLTNDSGNVLIMMPHPERVFRNVCNVWENPFTGADGPWMKLFRNARAYY